MFATARYAVLELFVQLVGVYFAAQTKSRYPKAEEREVRKQRQKATVHTHIPHIHHHSLDGDVCKETNKSQRWVIRPHVLIAVTFAQICFLCLIV